MVVGKGLAKLRAARGLRQEDVAMSARDLGLGWDRATVAAIETGRRDITLTEGFLLPHVLQEVIGHQVAVWELVDEDAKVAIGPETWMIGKHVRYALGADNPKEEWLAIQPVIWPTDAERKAAIRLGMTPEAVMRRGRGRWGQSLDDERDQRLGDTSQVPARTVQARRGHLTRQLIAELSTWPAKGKGTK